MTELIVNAIQKLLATVVLLALTVVIARQVKLRADRAAYLRRRDAAIAELISNVAYVGVLVLGVAFTLATVFQTSVSAIVAALGVSGLALSLALQDVLRNFIAGIYILLEKPYSIGDRISLRDFTGEIEGVELRTTLLRTSTGAQVLVPNSVLMTDIVTNKSTGNLQPYVVELEGTPELLSGGLERYRHLAGSHADVSPELPPEVTVQSLDAESATIRLRFWTEQTSSAVLEVVRELQRLLPQCRVSAKAE